MLLEYPTSGVTFKSPNRALLNPEPLHQSRPLSIYLSVCIYVTKPEDIVEYMLLFKGEHPLINTPSTSRDIKSKFAP
jgi:hypothetical protein